MRNQAAKDASELEALEQREWRESLDYVIQQGDRGRVQRLLAGLRHHARNPSASPVLLNLQVPAEQRDLRAAARSPAPEQAAFREPC